MEDVKLEIRKLFSDRIEVEDSTLDYITSYHGRPNAEVIQIEALSRAVLENVVNPYALIQGSIVKLYGTSEAIPPRPRSEQQVDNVTLWIHSYRGETYGPGKGYFSLPNDQIGKDSAVVDFGILESYIDKQDELRKQLQVTQKIASDAEKFMESLRKS